MDSKVNGGDAKEESTDEVDFVPTSVAKNGICVPHKSFNPLKKGFLCRNSSLNNNINNNNNHLPKTMLKKTSVYGDCEIQTAVKSHISALDRLQLFHFPLRRKNDSLEKSSLSQSSKEHRPKLIKSSSIARLFGNTYSTRKSEEAQAAVALKKSNSVSEKFSNKSLESDDEFTFRMNEHQMSLSESASNLSSLESSIAGPTEKSNTMTIKSITKGIGKLLRRNCDSVAISAPDPEYKVFYLGNVLTGWAKGDACIEKPLATLWRNYTQNNKPEVLMRLKVCPSGLKATTRQHGLTEYWSHRITFCSAPRSYPKIFCWIYRHEGRKLKHELRCHAVICSRDVQCQEIASTLKQNLTIALREFKRDKINKQNARLSLANAADENPSMPRRKILLSTGGNNYRPPLERSKSAPKLFAIEEIVGEEDEEEDCDEATKAKKQDEKKKLDEVKPCCKEDYLYPSITLGRRRCRRGHSIRKSRLLRGSILTQKSYPPNKNPPVSSEIDLVDEKSEVPEDACASLSSEYTVSSIPYQTAPRKSLGSDEDFESFLLYNNYDSKEPLAGDLMSYFDLQLQAPANSMLISTVATMSMSDLLDDEMSLKNQRTSMSMVDLVDYQSDNELDEGDLEPHSDIYFNQDSLLATLRRQSKAASSENVQHQPFIHHSNNQADACNMPIGQSRNEFIFNRPAFEDDLSSETPSSLCMSEKTICVSLDSDEGSISSGCETSSTMTTNAEENHLPRRGSVLDRVRSFEQLAESQVVRDPIGERSMSGKFYTRSVTFPTDTSTGCKSGSFIIASPESSITRSGTLTRMENGSVTRTVQLKHDDDSDELSDESGYVEFQDLSLKSVFA